LWWDSIRELGEFGQFSRAGESQKRNLLGSSLLGYSRAGAVENLDDDDQSNCIGEGELRVLSAFGDSSESAGSRDCDGSSGGLVGIKFELDFHCRERYEEPGSAG
jgi:hypothetical protein